MDLKHVLSPFRLAGLELRNRVVRTAYGTNLGRGGISEDLIAHHEARARGGVALSVLEATGVHPSGPMTLNAWDDAVIPGYRELARRLHRHGMAVFSQLNHLGLEQGARGERPWSASALVSPSTGLRARAVSARQIGELIAGYAAAARRAREGGLDGVEVHCAHGHLLQQFLSPRTNRRDDAWGGDWAGRARLTLEVLRACREVLGGACVLGIRVGPQAIHGGIDVEDCIRLVRELEREGLVDYLSVSHGSIYNPHKIIGAMHEPAGYELEDSARVTAAATVPAVVTGRLRTLAEADDVIARGIADLTGLTRAHIADAELVARTRTGRAAEVRPCIACNQGCVGGLARGRLACTVNPLAGREAEQGEIAAVADPGRVVVVGGGPAGMEAARVAALRGHRVILLEAEAALGGALRFARRAPYHELIGDIADWQQRELQRLDVDVRLGCRTGARQIAALRPDHVILACGAGEPALIEQRHLPGRALAGPVPLLSPRGLLAGTEEPAAGRAVVLDETGGYEAVAAAEWLIERGTAVTWVTGFRSFAPQLEAALVGRPALERLRRGRFHLHTRAVLRDIGTSGCRLGWLDGGGDWRVAADLVVAALPGLPADGLAAALQRQECPVSVAGDARRAGDLQSAIREGHRAAMTL